MNIARFQLQDGSIHYGVLDGENVYAYAQERPEANTSIPFLPPLPQGIHTELPSYPLAEVTLLAPCRPSKIMAIGRNYAEHARERGSDIPDHPLLFLKPPTSIINPGEAIHYPPETNQLDYEAELVVVIGKQGRHIPRDEANEYIFGYTGGNDVSARDLQKSDNQWSRAKGFDTFCPLGPTIVTGNVMSNVPVRCRVNGEIRQDGNSDQMIFSIPELIEYISSVMTLLPGDIIMTGTPSGVGAATGHLLQPGDVVEVEIGTAGILRNPVIAGKGK